MDAIEDRLLAHARVLRSRGTAWPPGAQPAPEILDSWVRSARHGLDLHRAPELQVVGDAELGRRRDALGLVRRLARAELETLFQQIAGSNFLLAFADRDGVILDLYADNRFRTSGSDAGIVAGSCWREDVAGTNGLGTALATGASIAVNGPEHYFLSLGGISCTAAPIRDAEGRIVGVLDASSYFESRQRHTQALVQMASTHVENLLFAHQMRDATVVAIHPRAEFLGTLSAGLIALGEDGRVRAFNGRARGLLSGLRLEPGTPFESLFDEPFARFAARLRGGAELRLRDTLGSAVVAIGVHLPARPATPLRLPAALQAGGVAAPAAPGVLRGTPAAGFVAADAAVREAMHLVEAAVRLRAPVLIRGETGTGKELLARHAHERSGRRGAFVAVNCAALPAELFEAELFGYVGGAFTGARREGSAGLIAAADGGTLLLDEIGELPLPLQAALLRFLDDGQVRPVGGTAARTVDVQLLAATHVDLPAEVDAKRFRADLYWRLDTVAVTLPPLRARSDFAEIVQHVLRGLDPAARVDEAALARLARAPWPGNVRELRAVLTRALLRGSQRLGAAAFDGLLAEPAGHAAPRSALQRSAGERVRAAYAQCGGSVSRVARQLGISRTTVYRYLRDGR